MRLSSYLHVRHPNVVDAGIAPVKATVVRNVGKKLGRDTTGWSVQ